MAGDMTIAIIIPIYNQAEYLRACLDSLVAQTDGDFTAYCVNDGSTDGSQSIIDEYAARDARFVPVRQPNRGVSAARNAGLAAMNSPRLFRRPVGAEETGRKAAPVADEALLSSKRFTMRDKYDLIVSLGGNCSAAHNLRFRGLRPVSLPFDCVYLVDEQPIRFSIKESGDGFPNLLKRENLVEVRPGERGYAATHADRRQYVD